MKSIPIILFFFFLFEKVISFSKMRIFVKHEGGKENQLSLTVGRFSPIIIEATQDKSATVDVLPTETKVTFSDNNNFITEKETYEIRISDQRFIQTYIGIPCTNTIEGDSATISLTLSNPDGFINRNITVSINKEINEILIQPYVNSIPKLGFGYIYVSQPINNVDDLEIEFNVNYENSQEFIIDNLKIPKGYNNFTEGKFASTSDATHKVSLTPSFKEESMGKCFKIKVSEVEEKNTIDIEVTNEEFSNTTDKELTLVSIAQDSKPSILVYGVDAAPSILYCGIVASTLDLPTEQEILNGESSVSNKTLVQFFKKFITKSGTLRIPIYETSPYLKYKSKCVYRNNDDNEKTSTKSIFSSKRLFKFLNQGYSPVCVKGYFENESELKAVQELLPTVIGKGIHSSMKCGKSTSLRDTNYLYICAYNDGNCIGSVDSKTVLGLVETKEKIKTETGIEIKGDFNISVYNLRKPNLEVEEKLHNAEKYEIEIKSSDAKKKTCYESLTKYVEHNEFYYNFKESNKFEFESEIKRELKFPQDKYDENVYSANIKCYMESGLPFPWAEQEILQIVSHSQEKINCTETPERCVNVTKMDQYEEYKDQIGSSIISIYEVQYNFIQASYQEKNNMINDQLGDLPLVKSVKALEKKLKIPTMMILDLFVSLINCNEYDYKECRDKKYSIQEQSVMYLKRNFSNIERGGVYKTLSSYFESKEGEKAPFNVTDLKDTIFLLAYKFILSGNVGESYRLEEIRYIVQFATAFLLDTPDILDSIFKKMVTEDFKKNENLLIGLTLDYSSNMRNVLTYMDVLEKNEKNKAENGLQSNYSSGFINAVNEVLPKLIERLYDDEIHYYTTIITFSTRRLSKENPTTIELPLNWHSTPIKEERKESINITFDPKNSFNLSEVDRVLFTVYRKHPFSFNQDTTLSPLAVNIDLFDKKGQHLEQQSLLDKNVIKVSFVNIKEKKVTCYNLENGSLTDNNIETSRSSNYFQDDPKEDFYIECQSKLTGTIFIGGNEKPKEFMNKYLLIAIIIIGVILLLTIILVIIILVKKKKSLKEDNIDKGFLDKENNLDSKISIDD